MKICVFVEFSLFIVYDRFINSQNVWWASVTVVQSEAESQKTAQNIKNIWLSRGRRSSAGHLRRF